MSALLLYLTSLALPLLCLSLPLPLVFPFWPCLLFPPFYFASRWICPRGFCANIVLNIQNSINIKSIILSAWCYISNFLLMLCSVLESAVTLFSFLARSIFSAVRESTYHDQIYFSKYANADNYEAKYLYLGRSEIKKFYSFQFLYNLYFYLSRP